MADQGSATAVAAPAAHAIARRLAGDEDGALVVAVDVLVGAGMRTRRVLATVSGTALRTLAAVAAGAARPVVRAAGRVPGYRAARRRAVATVRSLAAEGRAERHALAYTASYTAVDLIVPLLVALVENTDVLAGADLEAVLDRVDLNAVVEQVDLDAVLRKVDIDAVLQRTQLSGVIVRSASGVASETLDIVRAQTGIDALGKFAGRVLGRHADGSPDGNGA